jgi:hypothetical protein
MIKFLTFIAIIIVSAFAGVGILAGYKVLDIKKEYRFKHRNHLVFLIASIGIGSFIYLGTWIASLISEDADYFFDSIYTVHLIPSLILASYFLYKIIYRIYFNAYSKKSTDIYEDHLPTQYYEKKGVFYLSPYYSTLAKTFKYLTLIIIGLISIGIGILYLINDSFLNFPVTIETFILLPLVLMELYTYFDGQLEDEVKKSSKKQDAPKERDTVWAELDNEYRGLWQQQLLCRYSVTNKYERQILNKTGKKDMLSESIAKSAAANKSNDFLYSRILSPIMKGEDMIIESCLLHSFSDIIVPIINIMFTASKRMMFICDNYRSVKQCEKWFEELDIKSNTANSNIVIDVLNYENTESIKIDSNVDIYIGTVDLALNSKAIFENIDVVFCLNVDKIISESALNLNLLASVLSSDRYDNVQYILFGNRVNGLKQTASQVFMRNDFGYQVVNSAIEKSLNADFWSTEKGWLQSAILSGFAAQYLGQLIPLALPAFKYDIHHVDIISSAQSFSDQMLSLQIAQPLLKKYMAKDIVNIDEAISFAENENFISLNDNSVVVVEDTSNNAALVLLNWLKYAKSNMFLNVVSSPYLLRDYIVANMDFFLSNVEAIGNILPVPKSNIKLSVYRLINQLCYGNVAEETLLREIKNQETDVKIDTFENDQVRFVTEALQDLTKRAFGTNIFFTSYLTSQRISKEKSMESKRYYKLLDSIKNELPERLFKNITFIDSEQSAKVLKRIPVFELYQNYLEGQYISFNGKYYLIDKIDYDNGIVELAYSSNNASIRYRQCRQISNVVHHGISKELPAMKVRDSILKKNILCADIEINTDGYYEFNNSISFAPGGFGYKKVDSKKKGLLRKYKSTNVLAVNISSPTIASMSEQEKFKLSFTLSVLLNEMFETLFSNIKQYIIVRSVVSDDSCFANFENEELINLYRPIVDSNTEDGINIYITEDTELEKGITDTIVTNFDNIIMRLLFDYLYWLLCEKDGKRVEKWFASDSGDFINVERMDKFLFLKYGDENISECLDLEGAYNCLYELILTGNDTLTYSRLGFIRKRAEDDPFKTLGVDAAEKSEVTSNTQTDTEPKDATVKDVTEMQTDIAQEDTTSDAIVSEEETIEKAEVASEMQTDIAQEDPASDAIVSEEETIEKAEVASEVQTDIAQEEPVSDTTIGTENTIVENVEETEGASNL